MLSAKTLRYFSLLVVVLTLGGALALPHLFHSQYYMHIMVLMWIYLILAVSFNLSAGSLGLFSMGFSAFFGLSGYATGLLTAKEGWSVGLGLLIGVLICAVASWVMGVVALRLKGPYYILITIASLGIVGGLASTLYNLTGGSSGLTNIPAPEIPMIKLGGFDLGWGNVRFDNPINYYYFALFFVVVTYILVYWLTNSRQGRAFTAVRDNEDLANSLGINPFRFRMIGSIASGVLAALSGWLYAHYVHIVDPSIFGFSIIFDVMFMVMLGGMGTLPGPAFGAVLVVFIPEILRMAQAWRMASLGLFLLVVVIFIPQGLYTTLWQQIRKLQQKKVLATASPPAADASSKG